MFTRLVLHALRGFFCGVLCMAGFFILGFGDDSGLGREITEMPDTIPVWIIVLGAVFAVIVAAVLLEEQGPVTAAPRESLTALIFSVLAIIFCAAAAKPLLSCVKGPPKAAFLTVALVVLVTAAIAGFLFAAAARPLRRVQKKFAPLQERLVSVRKCIEGALSEAEKDSELLKSRAVLLLNSCIAWVERIEELLRQAILHNSVEPTDRLARDIEQITEQAAEALLGEKAPKENAQWALKWHDAFLALTAKKDTAIAEA